jgi:hypothetical protein
MNIPYRTKRILQRIAMALLPVLVLALVAGVCWYIWAQRYVMYTADGHALLDFKLPPLSEGQAAKKPDEPDVTIRYDSGASDLEATELKQMVGYYVEPGDLANLDVVKAQIQALPSGTPVMIDVKSIQGNFFYSSSVSDRRNPDIDTNAMDELLDYLRVSDFYTIARLPALRDYHYGLNNVLDGMPTAGGYLWMDDSRCYWLNPTRQGTMNYLVSIITELKSLGFDEVVLADMAIPDTKSIVFKQDKVEAITKAAKTLVDTCSTESFAVSFVGGTEFPLPKGRSRLYLENATAIEAAAMVQQTGIEDPSVYIVFLTELHDTRFDAFSVMRPLSGAH